MYIFKDINGFNNIQAMYGNLKQTIRVSFKNQSVTDKSTEPIKAVVSKPLCDGMKRGRIHIDINRGYLKWIPFYSVRWGNVLSPMWQARAMAILGGYTYKSKTFGKGTWMEYLPNEYYDMSRVNSVQFHSACNSCHDVYWEFAHQCFGAWDYIHDIIVHDTRYALHKWYVENNKMIPEFNDKDWYLYDRCANDTVLMHPYYGPLRFRVMTVIDKNVENIFIIADKEAQRIGTLCKAITKARVEYLKQRYPLSNIEFIGSDITTDFTTLVFANNVIVTGHGSSFALWSTLANIGNVYLCKFKLGKGNRNKIKPKGLEKYANFHFFNDKYSEALFPEEATRIGVATRNDILNWIRYEDDIIENENIFEQ